MAAAYDVLVGFVHGGVAPIEGAGRFHSLERDVEEFGDGIPPDVLAVAEAGAVAVYAEVVGAREERRGGRSEGEDGAQDREEEEEKTHLEYEG